jgi:hypothetical protein
MPFQIEDNALFGTHHAVGVSLTDVQNDNRHSVSAADQRSPKCRR